VGSTRLEDAPHETAPSTSHRQKQKGKACQTFRFFMHVLVLAAWLEAKYHHVAELKTKRLTELEVDAQVQADRTDVTRLSESQPSAAQSAESAPSNIDVGVSAASALPRVGDSGALAPPTVLVPIGTRSFWETAKRDLQLNHPRVLAYALLVGHSGMRPAEDDDDDDDATTETLRLERERLLRVGCYAMVRPLDVLHAWLQTRPARPPAAVKTKDSSLSGSGEGGKPLTKQNHPNDAKAIEFRRLPPRLQLDCTYHSLASAADLLQMLACPPLSTRGGGSSTGEDDRVAPYRRLAALCRSVADQADTAMVDVQDIRMERVVAAAVRSPTPHGSPSSAVMGLAAAGVSDTTITSAGKAGKTRRRIAPTPCGP
jgi:hypothetical protein